LARRCRNADQPRRPLSIAAVVDGASRAAAAKIGGMDRQMLRDWVHRFNEGGPEGLINHRAPGAAAKLSAAQKAQLAALVE
jgi:transposase